jgi:SulP family sulfate permease
MAKPLYHQIKGDLVGGLTAGFIAFPRNIAFGILIFLPFGAEYASLGVMAGLMSLLVGNIVSAPLGSIPVMCVSTFSLSALLLMSMNQIVMSSLTKLGIDITLPLALSFCFLATFIAGTVQAFCGVTRIGNITKFIPYPVLSGLLNGTAVAIIFSQLKIIIDSDMEVLLTLAFYSFDNRIFLLVIVSLFTAAVALIGPRIIKSMPSVFFGLFFGSAIYYLIQHYSNIVPLGSTIGIISSEIPTPKYAAGIFTALLDPSLTSITGTVLLFGVGIGLADVLRSALSSLVVDLKMQVRSDFNKELVGEGIGNMVSAIFGGITSTGNATAALGNYAHGAKTYLSRIVCGLSVLIAIIIFHDVIALLPLVVLATMLIILTIPTMDFGFINKVKQVYVNEMDKSRGLVIDLLVIFFVAILVLLGNLFVALAVGLSLSIILYVLKNSRSLVRKQFGANQIPSNVSRLVKEVRYLQRLGRKIQIFDLEGSLFFGSADQIHDLIDPLLENDVETIILDLKRVTDIDSTAVEILLQCKRKTEQAGKSLLLGSVDEIVARKKFPELQETVKNTERFCYSSLEDAIADGEEWLLEKVFGVDLNDDEISLNDINAFQKLSRAELFCLKNYLVRREFQDQEFIITQGEKDRVIFFIVRGRADVISQFDDDIQRLGALCAGSMVGEMTLFDTQPRSASVKANGSVTCYSLSIDDLNKMKLNNPDVSYNLLLGLSREFANRLRNANKIVAHLKA